MRLGARAACRMERRTKEKNGQKRPWFWITHHRYLMVLFMMFMVLFKRTSSISMLVYCMLVHIPAGAESLRTVNA